MLYMYLMLLAYLYYTYFIAQAATGKQGVLGPTKIYLAVQPAPSSQQSIQSSTTANTPATPATKPQTAQQPVVSPPAATGLYLYDLIFFALIKLNL